MVRIELKAIENIAARVLIKYCVLAPMFEARLENTDFRSEQKEKTISALGLVFRSRR